MPLINAPRMSMELDQKCMVTTNSGVIAQKKCKTGTGRRIHRI
jgi:hypothetical protein